MGQQEKRKTTRTVSLNLLSYHCVDENDEIVMQGVGRTLNISEEGILLETHAPLNPEHSVSLFIALEEDLVDIQGRVIHSSASDNGKFNTGIEFVRPNKTTREIIEKSVSTFHGGQ
jgi:hypothetical protein